MNRHAVSAFAVLLAAAASAAAERVLWPGAADTEVKPQDDSRLEVLPDGAALVRTGTAAKWPGLRIDFTAGEADLTDYGRLTVAVSNAAATPCEVCLSVKSHALQGRSPGGSVTLAPHAAGSIAVNLRSMPWRLDAPLELAGMNGFPSCAGGSMFDLRRVVSLHVFRGGASAPAAFALTGARLDGEGVREKVLPAASFLPFADRYGQFVHDDWPGKAHGDADLAAAKADEEKWLAENGAGPRRDLDRYGGWLGGPQRRATGFFRTEKVDGKWWLVDPEGRLFFSHGIDCVRFADATGVEFREGYFAGLPPRDDPDFGEFYGRQTGVAAHGFYAQPDHVPYATYSFAAANRLRKYGRDWRRQSAELVHRRFRAWGVNTVANWSDESVTALRRTPYTLCLGTWGAPRLRDSRGWWGALPDPFSPKFADDFRRRARAAAEKMRDDPWCVGVFVDNELSWNDEPRMRSVAEKYFSTVAAILREELPNHLYLGCRLAWGSDAVFEEASKYCDVVSVNVYAHRFVRDLPRNAVDRPMINGEFHFGALDRGMFHTGLVATESQRARADAYIGYVESCLDHPRCVGTHWFQYQDQPLTGRSDGENYQIGFVNGVDAPYPEMVAASRRVAAEMYERRYGARTPSGGIVLSGGGMSAEVMPAWGGRVMGFGPAGGRNWLWRRDANATQAGWRNVGGEKTWAGRQYQWRRQFGVQAEWPPPAWFDADPFAVEFADAGSVSLLSAQSPGEVWRTALRREVSFEGQSLRIRSTLVPRGPTDEDPADLWNWSVTQIPDAKRLLVLATGRRRFHRAKGTEPLPVRAQYGDVRAYDFEDFGPGAVVFFDASVLAAEFDDGWLVVRQRVDPRLVEPFEKPCAAVYHSGPMGPDPTARYIELEFLSYGPDATMDVLLSVLPPMSEADLAARLK